ncbi:hypothetical protein WA026_008951 [Henosepilachna vigintioctopunctata]|uniref:Lipase domain-containing protein n=1 Tax=Henosepilachna vigintioctopunctata TaxID=420089 RepID=A0AAW1V976_9CUCU
MLVLVLFLSVAAVSSAHPGIHSNEFALTFPNRDDDNTLIAELLDAEKEIKAQPSDLKIYFYSRKNRNNPILIDNNDISALENSGFFNTSVRLISFTHGWLDDYTSETSTLLTDAILETDDVNVLVSDWSSFSKLGYLRAKFAVPSLGNYLGSVIDKIVAAFKISHKQFTLIGHSLGAHIAGAAGSVTEQKVDVIIGLDAALPFFSISDIDNRLDPSDADFVHAIHTAGGFLGFSTPIGHSDYFPNGGRTQKGCFFDIFRSCSHVRSVKYLAESISNKQKFWAYKCHDYSAYKKGICVTKENQSFMGSLNPDKSARGSYYLETNSASPYAMDVSPKYS